jgi:hypothetical protein
VSRRRAVGDEIPSSMAMGRKPKVGRGGLNAIVGLALFNNDVCQLPFDLFWIIQIKFKSSENCSNSNKFDKKYEFNSVILIQTYSVE